ncbi:MAG: hypothetical protein JXP34_14565 [Planctomycetes bacterium]|nr:hypothetical protein [Planctomycetota bacterium]
MGPCTEIHDFTVRRASLSLIARIGDAYGLFTNIAADRIGQEGRDDPASGPGRGIAFRGLRVSDELTIGNVDWGPVSHEP